MSATISEAKLNTTVQQEDKDSQDFLQSLNKQKQTATINDVKLETIVEQRVTAEQPTPTSTPPVNNKRKAVPKATVINLTNFKFKSDATVGPLGKGSFKNAKITRACDSCPLMVSLHGGGEIHKDFGVKACRFGGFNITMTLTTEDYQHLATVHDQMVALVLTRRDEYFPSSSTLDDDLKKMVNATVYAPRKKKNSEEYWSASMSIKVDKEEDLMSNRRGKRRCKVKNQEGTYIDNIFDLQGSTWKSAVLELAFVYVQTTGSFGISKRLRLLKVSTVADELDVDSDSDN